MRWNLVWGLVLIVCATWSVPALAKGKDEIDAKAKAAMTLSMEAYAEGRFASALSYCEEAATFAPDNDDILAVCLSLYQRNDRYEESLAVSKRLRKLSADAEKNYGLCFVDGISYFKLHRWQEAIASYTSCETLGDKQLASVAMGNLAEIHMVSNDLPASVEAYHRSLTYDENNVHAIFGAVVAYQRMGEEEKAYALFLDGIQRDPDLRFFTESIFEPESEGLYHRASLAYFGMQDDEAAFYGKESLEKEQRPAFKAYGKAFLDTLEKRSNARVQHFPVVTEGVSQVAINDSQTHLAIATGQGALYLVSLLDSKVDCLVSEGAPFQGVGFLGSELRAISREFRYTLDVTAEHKALYYFANTLFAPLGMASDVKRILLTDGESVWVSPFEDMTGVLPLEKALADGELVSIQLDGKAYVFDNSGDLDFLQRQGFKSAVALRKIAVHPTKPYMALVYGSFALITDLALNPITAVQMTERSPNAQLSFDATGKHLITISGTLAELWSLEALGLKL